MKAWSHFKTITHHKLIVMKNCFKVGLFKQGLLHDLSKYTPTEFFVGCKYYQGNQSPNNAERDALGCSYAWLHHKGRNKHHFEYWIDYSIAAHKGMAPTKMPTKYVVEMLMDRIAASRIYLKEEYTDSAPLNYYLKGRDYMMMHEESKELLEQLLVMLSEKGEKSTFSYIRKNVLRS